MKVKVLIPIILLSRIIFSQNVGIGTNSPNNSSILEVYSKSRGVIISKITELERINITTPVEALTVYQTNNKKGLYYFDGISWQFIGNKENDAWKINIGNGSTNISFLSDNVGFGTSNPSSEIDVRGYVAANNFFTIIPLYKGTGFTVNNNSPVDVPNCETVINPTVFEENGNLEVKMIIRATSRSGTNHFQLRVHNGTNQYYPIVDTDAWTWGWTGGGETVTSPWKDWNAGVTPYELHLNAWAENTGDYVDVNSVILVIREKQ